MKKKKKKDARTQRPLMIPLPARPSLPPHISPVTPSCSSLCKNRNEKRQKKKPVSQTQKRLGFFPLEGGGKQKGKRKQEQRVRDKTTVKQQETPNDEGTETICCWLIFFVRIPSGMEPLVTGFVTSFCKPNGSSSPRRSWLSVVHFFFSSSSSSSSSLLARPPLVKSRVSSNFVAFK
ncbi:hypothetical protein LZ30DRAFT_115853 [Colletotrichum cereale]|nr:hypothetical protein LZ30DRAFT_115853 [Colletotrichum cereale]